jgi:exodeoxyribonuclease-5
MVLTAKQEEGLKTILSRYQLGEKYTVISGYAGTGKSTLVKFAIEALDVEKHKVAYATYTGKAAEVLRKKGNEGAMTLHRLLYDSFPRPGGGFFRKPKLYLDYTIVVVDEVSMVPKSMIDMLLKHKVYVIFLGDPFQLPQIDKEEMHNLLDHPHVFLDEVMRQAAESEIIQITMKIRNKEDIPYMNGKEVIVMPKAQLVDGCYTWADQILTATNQTRKFINDYVRKMYGFSGLPQEGERMICLRNYWEDCADTGESLVNGTTGIVHNPVEGEIIIPHWVQIDNHVLQSIDCEFEAEGGSIFENVRMDKHLIEIGDKCVDWRTAYRLGQLRNRIGDVIPREFDFGYAITCHKAQGSQWGKVLVIEENFPRDKVEHARWLYTACTRPEEKLVLVR